MPTKPKKGERRVKAWAVVYEDGSGIASSMTSTLYIYDSQAVAERNARIIADSTVRPCTISLPSLSKNKKK